MSSTAGNEGLATGTRAQPRLQHNALSLFETISATWVFERCYSDTFL